uniref:Acriflavin resistance protein n=1 Tax=Magnetococcus massalia (strain MO-1) TaxID=451514 RepID=A0A1S7LHX6_MAGMO|nr:Conserved membrane protein of unknown function. Putative acriflavin resistance protein. Putative cation/multidrug efflux pump, Acr family [Candidatus Magnetococcus massalia]
MIAWFARHPTAANLLMAVFIILGLVSLPDLRRETFPEIQSDEVQITIRYPGATTQEVEDALCRRLEDGLEGVVNLHEMRCEAEEGLATAIAQMREGASMMRFLDDVKSEVDAIDDFPDAAEQPVVEELGRTEQVVSIAVTGPDEPVALKAYAEQIKSQLMGLPQVAEVTIDGFSDHQILIEVPQWRLRQYNLSPSDIANAVSRHSVGTPLGTLEGGAEELLLRFDDQRKSVEELEQLVVLSGKSGAAIRLGQIATLTDRFEQDEKKIHFDGRRAAILTIFRTKDQDLLKTLAAVRSFVEQLPRPEGVSLILTQDRASVVQDRLNLLMHNGLQGIIMVFLVLWLFFSLRYSFWVSMGLPVSFLGALFLLPFVGVTVNMISMVGLLIGIGLLMDDAIVIAENIARRLQKGDAPMDAAVKGVQQVLPGILSSFATTLLVFGSLVFLSGEMGQILRIMPLVLILVITVSLVEAFWVLPNHLGHAMEKSLQKPPNRFRQSFEAGFDALREKLFGPLLDRAVDQRYLTLGISFMLLIMALAMPAGGLLKFVPFPDLDGDLLEARVLLPQGTPLQRTEEVVAALESAAAAVNAEFKEQQPDKQNLVKHVTVIYGQNPDAHESGPHVARVMVDLLSTEIRTTPLDSFREAWRKATGPQADVIAINYAEPTIGPGGRAIELRLQSDNMQQLTGASHALQGFLNRYDGVLDLRDDLRPGKRTVQLKLKPGAGVLGLDAKLVADQLRTAYQGLEVDSFPLGPEQYAVDLRLSADDRMGLQNLEDITLVSNQGAQVPLTMVAEITIARDWARIQRIDGVPTVTIEGDVDNRRANAQELIELTKQQFLPQMKRDFPAVRMDVQGKSADTAKTGKSIVRNVILGMVGVYMLLALQFRGYLAPLTVMLVIPTTLVGAVLGHMLMGLPLTMPSIIGMTSLFGVVVNDSILLVTFIREHHRDGMPTKEAAKLAGRARFRPILLTSITTVAGLMPLLLEKSLQAQILIPLATSLAFGLSVATLAALFVVPAVYCILDDFLLAPRR